MARTREDVRRKNNTMIGAGALVGAVIGFLFAGPVGAVKGALYGAQIGMMFGSAVLPDGPRVDNLSNNSGSNYGVSRPVTYGKDVVPTNIIWLKANKIQEFSRQEEVGKRQYQTLYNYSASFALALGEGEQSEVKEVYANNILIYKDADPRYQATAVQGQNKENGVVSTVRFYRGDYLQLPDENIIADRGVNAPAFRGEAFILFTNFDLTGKYFNTLPTFRIVTQRKRFDIDLTPRPAEVYIEDTTYTDSAANSTTRPLLGISGNLLNNRYEMYTHYTGVPVTGGRRGEQIQFNTGHWMPVLHSQGLIGVSWMARIGEDSGSITSGNTWGEQMWQGNIPSVNPQTTFKVDYSYDIAFPTTLTKYSFNVARIRYDESALHPEVRGESAGAGYDIVDRPAFDTFDEQELRLYAFDCPFDNTTFLSIRQDGSRFSASTRDLAIHSLFVLPITNRDDLYLIGWRQEGFNATTFGLAYVDYDRFVIHRLQGFNLEDYNFPSTYGVYATADAAPAAYSSRGAKDFKALFFNDNVYIYKPRNISGDWVFAGVLVIPDISKIKWSWPVQVKKEQTMFSWSTFTFYAGGDYYTVNQTYLDYDNPRKVIDTWYVTNTWWTDLIPDGRNGQMYALSRVDLSTASGGVTYAQALTRLSTHNVNHIYKVYNDTLATITDYGNFATFCTANTIPFSASSSEPGCMIANNGIYGLYFMTPYAIVQYKDGAYSLFYKQTFRTIAGNNYVLEEINTSASAIHTPAGRKHCINMLVAEDNDDITDVILVMQFMNGTTSGSSLGNCYGELRRVRYYHTPYLDELLAGETVTLDEVFAAEFERTGLLTSSDYDVSLLSGITVRGFTIAEQSTVADNLRAIMSTYFVDVIEEDYKLKCVPRTTASIKRTIAYTDLQAGEPGKPVFEIRATVPATYKTPTLYQATYRDVDAQYESNTQQIENPFGETSSTSDLQLPIVLSSDEAYQTLERSMRATQYAQRGMIEFSVTMKHSDLEAGHWVTVETEDGSTFTGRIIDIDKGAPGIVKINMVQDVLSNYATQSIAQTGQSTDYEAPASRKFTPLLIDAIPFLPQETGVGFWFGAYSDPDTRVQFVFDIQTSSGSNIGLNIEYNQSRLAAASCGRADNNFLTSSGNPGYIDYTQSLTVRLLGGELNTVTEAQLLGDEKTNTYFYGDDGRWEIIKVLVWTDNSDGTYTGTGLLRGYKGTEHLMQNHEAGDKVISVNGMQRVVCDTNYINLPVQGIFRSPDSVGGQDRVEYRLKRWLSTDTDKFLPPKNLYARRTSTNDWVMEWRRQTRYGIEWRNGSDASLDTAVERYKIYIINGSDNDKVVRTITADRTTTVTYTSAQQVTDWGSNRTTIRFAVQQVNSLTLSTTDELYRSGTPALGVF
jgi:hypothetical protein